MLHVVDPEVSAALVLGDGGTEPPVMTEGLDARQPADAVRPEMLIRKGEPHTEILAAAEAGDHDLIVLGASRSRGPLAGLLGTTIQRVLRGSTRPVLSVRQQPQGPYRRVLIASDLSDPADLAAQTALWLGVLDSARIRLVHATGGDAAAAADTAPEAGLRALAARLDPVPSDRIEVSVLLAVC